MAAGQAGTSFLAGGTFLLAGDRREKPPTVIDVGRILPKAIERSGGALSIGAGATFQDLVDSAAVPAILRDAALSMVNRNVRNRATVGGNIGAGKSCASLMPVFLALGAKLRVATPSSGSARPETRIIAEWSGRPEGIILSIDLELGTGMKGAFARWTRTACDVSVLTACVAYRAEGGPAGGGALRGLSIAMGGLGPHARRFPELVAPFEGRPLPSTADIESIAGPLFQPRSDWRGSAAFKRLRAASLLADALHHAEVIA